MEARAQKIFHQQLRQPLHTSTFGSALSTAAPVFDQMRASSSTNKHVSSSSAEDKTVAISSNVQEKHSVASALMAAHKSKDIGAAGTIAPAASEVKQAVTDAASAAGPTIDDNKDREPLSLIEFGPANVLRVSPMAAVLMDTSSSSSLSEKDSTGPVPEKDLGHLPDFSTRSPRHISMIIVIHMAVLALVLSGALCMHSKVKVPYRKKKERPPLETKESGPAPATEPDSCSNGSPSTCDFRLLDTYGGQSSCSKHKYVPTACQGAGCEGQTKKTTKRYERQYVPACWPAMEVPRQGLSFLVPLHELGRLGCDGFDVIDCSGKPVLHVARDTFLDRRMQLTMIQSADVPSDPVATVVQKALLGKEVPAVLGDLEIYGPHGKLVGHLEPSGDSHYIVRRTDGEPLLMLSGNHLCLEFSATAPSSAQVFSASCDTANAGQISGGDYFEVHVKPGGDPILAVLSVLAILLFCDPDKRTSKGALMR
eukprot:gnl/TRDRNA2_/TRDRNA2_154959_c0_seq2.p1 gnl/TRDRNA2_/TRDRNA2_154959_c0~~gnl/TRDRNA2_/TRDRNA2_154959_c0_seq2.p1  ORF type:complete len:532 (+),score=90.83 gnl/TRDRNA2_/TRDRNA2_154959_c0_seq2:155-1597(+)